MEMICFAGGFLMLLFIICSGIVCIMLGKKSRPFALGCLLPCTLLFLLAAVGTAKVLFLDEPLFMAANGGDVKAVNQLLARGATPNSDFEGSSALSAAAEKGHRQVVCILIEHGAKVNTNEHTPALCAAVEAGHTEIVRILLQHGARVDVQDSWTGFTPLQTAKINGNAEIKRLLIQAGATK